MGGNGEVKKKAFHWGDKNLTDLERASLYFGVPAINLGEFDIDNELIALVPRDLAERHCCIPISRAGSVLLLAMADPSNLYAISEVEVFTECAVEVVVASDDAIKEAIRVHYGEADDD